MTPARPSWRGAVDDAGIGSLVLTRQTLLRARTCANVPPPAATAPESQQPVAFVPEPC